MGGGAVGEGRTGPSAGATGAGGPAGTTPSRVWKWRMPGGDGNRPEGAVIRPDGMTSGSPAASPSRTGRTETLAGSGPGPSTWRAPDSPGPVPAGSRTTTASPSPRTSAASTVFVGVAAANPVHLRRQPAKSYLPFFVVLFFLPLYASRIAKSPASVTAATSGQKVSALTFQ